MIMLHWLRSIDPIACGGGFNRKHVKQYKPVLLYRYTEIGMRIKML